MLPEPSGNKQAPLARMASDVYRSRPPQYPRLWFGLRAYDAYRENAARTPCSFLVLRRRGTAGQLLLVSLSPCRSYGRNHSSRQKPQQYTSLYCNPINRQGGRRADRSCVSVIPVSLCTGEAFSPRVIVVVLPLPSVLDVFPSVEPTTIVNACIQLTGFEQN